MPLRITTVDGKRTVVCEPIPPAIGVLPPQKWRPSAHATMLQSALLRARRTARSAGRSHPSAESAGTPDRALLRLRDRSSGGLAMSET
jgi:hypothetical protein